jgi:hypothetical protein
VLVEAGLAAAESALSAPLAARAEERVRGELAVQRARHDRAAAAAAREAAAAAAAVAAAARAKAKARARARWGGTVAWGVRTAVFAPFRANSSRRQLRPR